MRDSRLFRIVYALLEQGQVSASELARSLEVSVRTIYRDMDALSAAGIPVYALPGRGGGYALLDRQVFSKSLLSEQEQARILLALQRLPAPDQDQQLLAKLSALFDRTPADWITVDLTRWGGAGEESALFALLKRAILTRRALSFTYAAAGRPPQKRKVFPGRLAYKGFAWYLQGICQTRQDWRAFKLTRITHLQVETQSFAPLPPAPPLQEAEQAASSTLLVLRFAPEAAFRIYDEFFPSQITVLPDGAFLVRASFPEGAWLTGYLLSFGRLVEVLEPTQVRERLAQIALETFLKHAKP